MRPLVTLIFLLFFTNCTLAQLEIIFGDSLVGEKGIVSHVMPDKSIWVVGVTDNGPNGAQDIFLVKVDTNGQLISKMSYYGSPDRDYVNNMLVQDGKMILVGETHYANHLDANIYVFDTAGTLIQSNLFGSNTSSEQFYDAKPTNDGGCIVAGFSAVPNVPGNDMLLAKFDSSFQLTWIQSYDLGSNDVAMTAFERPDGGYLVVGDQDQPGGNYNIIMMGCDQYGTYEWDSLVPSSFNGGCKTMKVFNNAIYIVGEISTPTSTYFDIYLCKVNWNGSVEWQKTIPKTDLGDAAFDLIPYGTDRFLMTGYLYNPLKTSTDLFVMTIDTNGQLIQEKTYGSDLFDMGYDLKWLDSTRFVATGFKTENSNQVFVLIDNTNNLTNTSISTIQRPKLQIYPNPSDGIFNVSSDQIKNINIWTLDGQLYQNIDPSSHQIDLQHADEGFYVCTIHYLNGLIQSRILHKVNP